MPSRLSIVAAAGAAAAAAACSRGAPPSAAPTPAPVAAPETPGPNAAELRRDLFAFADDSMRGRETGTPDARRAAVFIADRLASLGLEPAGDSMYFQRVPLVSERLGPGTRFVVVAGKDSTRLRLSDDVAPLVNLGPGAPEPKHAAAGEMVFAGYGVYAPALRRDDLTPLSKMDLRGKVVVVVQGAPANADSAQRAALESQAELSARLGRLVPMRPAAVIVLMSGKAADFYAQAAPELLRSVSAARGGLAATDADRPLPMFVLGLARAGSPLLPPGWPANDTVQSLPGRRFEGNIDLRREPFTAYNVVATVRGTDARMARTYVAFGAHYDHIGIQTPVNGDSIANGADDDGSGSMTMLALARAVRAHPPRRSVLFVWHVGEEKGLLGSSYFVEHPTVPIDSIVAQLNADMIGRNAPDLLYIVGPHAAPNDQSKVLGAIVDSVNATEARPFAIDRTWDDPNHPEHIYQRSDHFNYARKGIPIIFFTTGLHDDYHKVSDEPSKIDYEKMARVGQLMLDVGMAVGDRVSRPR